MASIWAELRRRNVVKVGAAYAIVAWALVEIVATIEGPLSLPDWVDTVIIVLLAVGFPIALILSWAYDMTPHGIKAASAVAPTTGAARVAGQRPNHVTLGLMMAILGFLLLDRFVLEPRTAAPGVSSTGETPIASSLEVQRLFMDLGPMIGVGGLGGLSAHLALSPDGTRLVYATRLRGEEFERVYLRPFEQFDARPISRTENAERPFFSPDGEQVGFFSELGLTTVSVRGGASESLTGRLGLVTGGAWLNDDSIVYGARDASGGRGLFRIPASGGSPDVLLVSDEEAGYVSPERLPGGEAILLVIRPGRGGSEPAREGSIAVMSLDSREVSTLIGTAFAPRYSPTGHIVFAREGGLWAAPFDVDQLQITGPEVQLVEGIQQLGDTGEAAYAISEDGLLVYAPGGDVTGGAGPTLKHLVWVDRLGREERLNTEPQAYTNPRLSPDGERVAVTIQGQGSQDIWIYDLVRGGRIRLTTELGPDNRPVWTPDGERVVFRSNRDGGRIFWRAADGTGPVVRLSETGTHEAFTPDGRHLILRDDGLRVLSMEDDGASEPHLEAGLGAGHVELSPDGRWMAYTSDETGQEEIYVRPFPNVSEGRWPISTDGGFESRWGPNGDTLFFRNDQDMMSVAIETAPEFTAGIPTRLFTGNYSGVDQNESSVARPSYDLSPDGARFLMLKYADPADSESTLMQIAVVNNWFEELDRLAPPSQ